MKCCLNCFYAAAWYHNDPQHSDRKAYAKSVDPDQTAPGGAV